MSSNSSSLKPVSESEFFTDPSYVSTLSNAELKAHIEKTRGQLATTLDELEVKSNPSLQYERLKGRLKKRLITMKREQPVALASLGVTAIAIAGVVVYAVVRGGGKR